MATGTLITDSNIKLLNVTFPEYLHAASSLLPENNPLPDTHILNTQFCLFVIVREKELKSVLKKRENL